MFNVDFISFLMSIILICILKLLWLGTDRLQAHIGYMYNWIILNIRINVMMFNVDTSRFSIPGLLICVNCIIVLHLFENYGNSVYYSGAFIRDLR